jgi:hypothetical protein
LAPVVVKFRGAFTKMPTLHCLERRRSLAEAWCDSFHIGDTPAMTTKVTDLLVAMGLLVSQVASAPASASPAGDDCRKTICNSAVSACMRADQTLNPFARTEAEKKTYCAAFFTGCMSRDITPDLPWYSPDMVARFLQCPP